MATSQPTVTKDASPNTLMVLVDYDPGGDYDHHKTFLLLTFADTLDKATRDRVVERLRHTPQAYLPDTTYPSEAGDISTTVTMRNVVTACAEEGAPVATVQVIDGYTYLDTNPHNADLSATPDEINRQSDVGTYTVTNPGD